MTILWLLRLRLWCWLLLLLLIGWLVDWWIDWLLDWLINLLISWISFKLRVCIMWAIAASVEPNEANSEIENTTVSSRAGNNRFDVLLLGCSWCVDCLTVWLIVCFKYWLFEFCVLCCSNVLFRFWIRLLSMLFLLRHCLIDCSICGLMGCLIDWVIELLVVWLIYWHLLLLNQIAPIADEFCD